jgi:hypothetical protein
MNRKLDRAVFVIDSLARPRVLLDANAVRYCYGRPGFTTAELEQLRRAMRELARTDLVRFVTTHPVGWELTQVYFDQSLGPAAYAEHLEFYLAISSEWVVKNEYQRMRLELQLGRRLTLPEAFMRVDIPTTMRMQQAPAYLKQLHDMQRQHKDDERAQEAAKRTTLVAELDAKVPNWRTTFPLEAAAGWTKVVRGFAKGEMRRFAKEHGIRIAPSAWPRPDDLPTFWYGESFYTAKVLFVFIDTNKQLTSKSSLNAMPDMMDATHFRDAAYADVLVTQDENFRTVAEKARTGLKILSFDEFARLVLARTSGLAL